MSNTTAPIIIRPMFQKELAAICQCSTYEVRKRLRACIKVHKKVFDGFNPQKKGKQQLSKEQVRIFLIHNDILPEEFTPPAG